MLDTDQEPDVDAERDERDKRGDEAKEGGDEHQREVVGDCKQQGEEGHDRSYSKLYRQAISSQFSAKSIKIANIPAT